MSNHAELIIVNGGLKTVDAARPTAEAPAVAVGHIIAIGERAAIEGLRGPATLVIDAEGGSVAPGFIEGSHRDDRTPQQL